MFSVPKVPKLGGEGSAEKRKLKRAVKAILEELGLSSFYHSVAVYIDTKITDEQAKKIVKTVLEVLGDGKRKSARQGSGKAR